MNQGLQTWDAHGTLMLDGSMRVGKIIDVFESTTDNGARAIANTELGSVFLFQEETSFDLGSRTLYVLPQVSYAQGVVSWVFVDFKFGRNYLPRRSMRISVGVF
ncbi:MULTISPECIES: hypothetical protein [unclassified Pseudomonas]|uniref:hypothetical protein n=1 Tax=unclassified Pseudomonas TaxID=196821 RepID=UPI000C88B510|nr:MULTISPECIES: hypothetical protein [unclassified Pseudomonas]PNA02877.1 hypothetical protein C1X79_00470 [Pseudomonas sp. FW305-42]PNA27607.1 hypothetical protein C1X78_02215 [Pseudomonas sp. MPR-R1B]PNB29675.1 hypothetical protein C1X80_00950 [Pseudomonas sp. DP16D-E2]PNB45231.1 hypothetical protein C1X75_02865 [Pseudomonas sp. FW305-17]PNB63600.1 hypothetical protein C1X77_06240 [Pseudomonas sp. GW531-E2]